MASAFVSTNDFIISVSVIPKLNGRVGMIVPNVLRLFTLPIVSYMEQLFR